jgi:hypothetical protein
MVRRGNVETRMTHMARMTRMTLLTRMTRMTHTARMTGGRRPNRIFFQNAIIIIYGQFFFKRKKACLKINFLGK